MIDKIIVRYVFNHPLIQDTSGVERSPISMTGSEYIIICTHSREENVNHSIDFTSNGYVPH